MSRAWILAALAATAICVHAGPGRAVPVDVELALAVDVSGSTDASEFQLMINGYANAFRSPDVQTAIGSGPNGQIAVSMYFWTATESAALQAVKIPFTLVTAGSASGFADRIADLLDPVTEILTPGGPLPIDPPLLEPFFLDTSDPQTVQIFGGNGNGSGFTAVAQANDFGRALLLAPNGFEGARLVLDISGDGQENFDHDPAGCSDALACTPRGQIISPLDPSLINDPDRYFAAVIAARAAALQAGVIINGLPIETDIPDLSEEFYQPYVIGGPGAFVEPAAGFEAFDTAVRAKLASEIVPEPGAGALLLLALSACAARARTGRVPSAPGSV